MSRHEANDEAWDRLEQRCAEAERKLAELQAEMRSHVCDAAPKLAALEKRIADIRREAFEEAAAICDRLEDEVPYANEAGYFAYAFRAAADEIRTRMEKP